MLKIIIKKEKFLEIHQLYCYNYLILLVAVRIGLPVFVVGVLGPMLKIFVVAGCCGPALNWKAFAFGALNENGAAALWVGADVGPELKLNGFEAS